MAIMTSLRARKYATVMGLDISTKSCAYCVFDDQGPIMYGEIHFDGSNVFDRLADANKKMQESGISADLYVVEGAVYVQNKKTVILLAQAIGAVMSSLMRSGGDAAEVSPIFWQNAIGNKALTKTEKQAIMDANPGKSKVWYTAANREFRKKRTMKWVEDNYGIKCDSDNLSDAIALAAVAYDKYNQ